MAAAGCTAGDTTGVRGNRAEAGYLDVELSTLGSNEVFLLRDIVGAPTVVNFFASWCAPCVREMPEIEAFKQEVGGAVQFVGVNVEDTVDDATALVEETEITWRVVRDPDGALVRAVGVRGMPTTLLLDDQGDIVVDHTGALTTAQLRKMVRDELGIEVQPR